MLSWVEHEKSFITSRSGLSQYLGNYVYYQSILCQIVYKLLISLLMFIEIHILFFFVFLNTHIVCKYMNCNLREGPVTHMQDLD